MGEAPSRGWRGRREPSLGPLDGGGRGGGAPFPSYDALVEIIYVPLRGIKLRAPEAMAIYSNYRSDMQKAHD